MLTLGQAACLVIGMEPTAENRTKAKDLLEQTPFTVTYFSDTNPMEPVAMGMSIVKQNPFKYRSYPETPPRNPRSDDDDLLEERSGTASCKTDPSLDLAVNCSKGYVVKLAETIFVKTDPGNDALYNRRFFTNQEVYDVLAASLPLLRTTHKPHKVFVWLAKSKNFGPLTTKRVKEVPKKGRYLWKLNDTSIDHTQETSSLFREHVRSSGGNWINIGYVRKSNTQEPSESKIRLLNMMISRLSKRCFCEKTFASPQCSASSKLLERDIPTIPLLSQLSNCNGDAQTMYSFLSACAKSVRLCIIDYAGLSTDPQDVLNMLKCNRAVKEIAIDHGSHIQVLSRHQLLHSKQKTEVFKCRTGPVRRSQI